MDDATPTEVTDQLGYLIRLAQAAIWQDLVGSFEPYGIRPQQYAILALIDSRGGSRLETLAQALAIRPPNLVKFVEDLVTRRLVVRRKLPSDRRVNSLCLTDEGSALLRELRVADARHERALVATLGAARLVPLCEDLRKLSTFTSLDEARIPARYA